ncbi:MULTISPECIES: DUF3592 domain-containing protein [unclassified Haloarcula]|uniref:DUF3592 domain-containing protein n=1 Tax=unclassified Haloarcula TaxID=2624677 RepID=UPI001CD9C8A9|nr:MULTISPECIES: DUF3592 domain-containing protein [unclassified Haloarcula]
MSDDGLSVNGPNTVGQSLLLLIAAIGLVSFGAVDYVQSTNAVSESVKVEATITEVGVETKGSSTGSGATVKHEPVVEFTYTYAGETYTGDKVFPGATPPRYDTEAAAQDVIAEYESETETTAYVNPDAPDQAFLKNHVSNRQYIFIGVGSVLALLGGFFTVKNYRRDRA